MLVDNNEPLKLHDGTLVYPDGRIVSPGEDRMVEIPSNAEARELVVRTRRKLSDLPDVPRTMNAISVILTYTLFGLDDTEISIATNLTVDQISRIRSNEAYTRMHETVVSSILDAESDDVRDIFRQNAREAANVFVHAMKSDKLGVKMNSAAQILDRGGFRPVDVIEHRHQVNGGLRIEIVKKDADTPTIDMGVL